MRRLEDKVAVITGAGRGPGFPDHAHEAGVDRARQDLLGLRHDGARGREARVNGALVHDGRADR